MCHLLQNSVMLLEIYGNLKFSKKWKPNILPSPIAISEYPAKSKKICNVYAIAPNHAIKTVLEEALNAASATIAN